MVDSIGVASLIVANAPVLSTASNENTPVVLPKPAPVQKNVADQVNISAAASQPVQPKVEYANPQILGTESVTMYKVDGQLYTRYRDQETGKVTYIPKEAQVLSNPGSAVHPVDITA